MNNSTALILAAGMGKRLGGLTTSTPKVLVQANGKTLLEHAIMFARALGVTNIVVVAGFCFEKVEALAKKIAPDATVVNNTEYTLQNLISLQKGLEQIPSGDVYLVHSDYIKRRHTVDAIRANHTGACLYASFEVQGTEEDCMKVKIDDHGNLMSLSKKLETFDALYSGDFFCPAEHLDAWKQAVIRASQQLPKETAVSEHSILELIATGTPVRVVDVGASDWFEIDTPEELIVANDGAKQAKDLLY